MRTIRVSLAFIWAAFLVNIVGCVILGIVWYIVGLGAFTRSVSSELSLIEIVAWIWTPGSMLVLYWELDDARWRLLGLIIGAIVSAFVFAIIVGVLREILKGEIKR